MEMTDPKIDLSPFFRAPYVNWDMPWLSDDFKPGQRLNRPDLFTVEAPITDQRFVADLALVQGITGDVTIQLPPHSDGSSFQMDFSGFIRKIERGEGDLIRVQVQVCHAPVTN
jgi:hypothetical protein